MRLVLPVFALIALGTICFSACEGEKRSQPKAVSDSELAEGFALLESNCLTCHSPQAGTNERLAPPMAMMKMHYVNEQTSFEEFSTALTEFVTNPEVSKSRMPGAIEKFGLMPKMDFSQDQLENIALYIYHTELEKPMWYEKHFREEQRKHGKHYSTKQPDYLKSGQKLAMSTKAILGKNLLGAINKYGTAGAVDFCNTRAIALTDSMANALNVVIKRVSDQPRNPENLAQNHEADFIEKAKHELSEKGKVSPTVLDIDGKKVGFYPIITNDMCMQCHGEPNEQIEATTLAKLNELYPDDKAQGYAANQLRGIWVVEMTPDSE